MSGFDRFADWVAGHVAHAWFFMLCLGIVVGWCLGLLQFGIKHELWHLALNSPTTAITFLLVALLHNTQHRFEQATNRRLERIIKAVCGEDPVDDPGQRPDDE